MEEPKRRTFFRDKIFEIRVHLNRVQDTHWAVCSPASLAGLVRRRMREMGKREGKRQIPKAQCGGRRGRDGVNGHGWTDVPPHYRSILTGWTTWAEPHNFTEWIRKGHLPSRLWAPRQTGMTTGFQACALPAGQNLRYSGQQPHLSSCWLDYTGSWDTPNGVSHSASKNDGLAHMSPKAPFTTFGA